MKSMQEQSKLIDAAIKTHTEKFGLNFGLRAFPGDTFSISKILSYWTDEEGVMLYTQIFKEDQGKWLAFAKGTPQELEANTVPLVPGNDDTDGAEREVGPEADVSEAEQGETTAHNDTTQDSQDTQMTENNNTQPALPSAQQFEEAKNMAAKKNTPKPVEKSTPKPEAKPEVVTLTKDELANIVQSAVAAVVAAAPAAKAAPKKKAPKKKATKKANKAKAKVDRKEANRTRAAEATAAAVAASGKTEAEVKAAFREAHEYAKEDQSAYKARYNEKLTELIGCARYAA